jgi:hypothetical protein
MANTSIYRNITSTGNADICTISCWFKRGPLATEYALFGGWRSNTTRFQVRFKTDDTIDVEYGYSSTWYSLITDRVFRDPSAWMHLVLAIDSTQGTPANREKLYINGVQETSFSTESYMPQNNDTLMTTSGDEMIVGGANSSSSSGTGNHSNWFKGEQSHFQFVDGLQLAPTEFGETDATDGMWKIKTTAYATPGTNGFFLKMEDSTNMDLDSSSNALAFTTEGTLTSTKDNPSNNFCTLNPLDNYYFGGTFTNGNNTTASTTSSYSMITSTLGMSSGKYYVEAKLQTGYPQLKFGITSRIANSTSDNMDYSGSTCFSGTGTLVLDTVTTALWGSTFAVGDIVGCALDMDNLRIYFSINGVWQNSANPSLGTGSETIVSPTGAIDRSRNCYFFSWSDNHASAGSTMEYNFGNGYFGTTAITSAGTNASGNGDFEYDVPTGFTALCTKGLNT